MQKRDYKQVFSQLRAVDGTEGGKKLEGYFIVFGVETELYPGWFEKVEREAVIESVDKGEIVALFNHDTAKVLGSQKASTLKIIVDEIGLRGTITVNENDTEAVNVYERVMRGDIGGCSFGFYITEDSTSEDENGDYHITIKNAEVFEISIVTFPAYKETNIEARSMLFEHKKNKLKERVKKCLKSLEKGLN